MVEDNYQSVLKNVKEACDDFKLDISRIKIIGVSKKKPSSAIIDAFKVGIVNIGENYVQEMVAKYDELPADIRNEIQWHFIGHLQSNKVKYIAPFVNVIHSVHSEKLAREIDKQAKKSSRVISVMIQVNISKEESKSGAKMNDVFSIVDGINKFENVKLIGLMAISGLESSKEEREAEFFEMNQLLKNINNKFNLNLQELSMGMTEDFDLALKHGSTMLRIGTAIFGDRTNV